jgi:hypothetical protein
MFSLQPPRHIPTLPISAASFFERGGGSCFDTGRQGAKLLIFTVVYLRLINW